MKVSSVLLVTCLLGLCHCRRSRVLTDRPVIEVLDDYAEDEIVTSDFVEETRKNRSSGQRLVWDLANGAVYEAEYTQPSARRHTNDRRVADVAVDKSPVTQSSRHTTILDIANPNRLLYKSFNYYFGTNAVQLIVPNKGISVSKLMYENGTVWTPSTGETFDHTKVYLNKDKKPELVLVVTTSSGASKEYYLELKDSKWKSCTNHEEKMRSLRDPAEWISNFELDLALANSTNECSIFETELLGVTTKHFFPKPGYLAKGVKDVSGLLWSSSKPIYTEGTIGRHSGYYNDYCLSCIIHKHGSVELLEMVVVETLSERSKYFEKVDGKWKEITGKDFNGKLDEMRNGETTHKPSESQ
ncbi:signal peptide-containing protein [Theileria equi strain WA]|uniref:Signal peptide-containing protein n=1 Tax=Theileria equi strain WA TaxID=1537102 RepID=L0AWP6_THEEQ|nr:signal peptide-containing protein [Theileria equi strain WA]AFZ79965.1 signal peptide-containing protein [Theileria equi strain WA]|eukprot:XP_004829631.1 signal peptide-containing protein [Theileria equi strain WA]